MKQLLLLLTLAAGLIAMGCGDDGGGADTGMMSTCLSNAMCDDAIACTIDICGAGGICRNDALDERCSDGLRCSPTMGCVESAMCTTDLDCDDELDCTFDTCGVGNRCSNMPLDERCEGAMTCDGAMGCIGSAGCSGDEECDDGIPCTLDTCGADATCSNSPQNALCTGMDEICSPTDGCSVLIPCDTDADCDDGNFCNGTELCVTEFGCSGTPVPRACDDTDTCTIDSCDTDLDMCVFTCDASMTECMCPGDAPSCSGAFTLSPAPAQSCALGFVNYNINRVDFENVGGVALNVTASTASFGAMTDAAPPLCPEFEASITVSGGCIETYTLRGTFTDADHFTGVFEANYTDMDMLSCALGGCANQSTAVTGTRM